MPIKNNIYQTVRDKNNPEEVEEKGPFLCSDNPWLGEGYYFWDDVLDRAHWWGIIHYDRQYMICQARADIENDKYLDLAGNMEQLKLFRKCYDEINKLHNGKVTTVQFVIEKLRRDKNFPYQAIRVLTEGCGGDEKVNFVENNRRSFLNYSPPMQICIYEKSIVKDYHVIYPDECIHYEVV